MAATTVRRLITRTMRGIGFLGRTTDPKANESTDAFDSLNDMIASWNRENLLLPYTLIQTLSLVINQSLYTIGVGGDVNIARPDKIERASFRLGTSPNYIEIPCRVAQNEKDWQLIRAKAVSTSLVTTVWYNPKYASGTAQGELNTWPVPAATGTLLLYIRDRLTQFATLDTTIDMPDGFLRALRYNLGVDIAAEFGVKLPDNWEKLAIASKAAIKSSNIKHGTLELEVPGISGKYSILSDSYR
jgi:hypothetical protein